MIPLCAAWWECIGHQWIAAGAYIRYGLTACVASSTTARHCSSSGWATTVQNTGLQKSVGSNSLKCSPCHPNPTPRCLWRLPHSKLLATPLDAATPCPTIGLGVGFISITRYHDINRRFIDLMIPHRQRSDDIVQEHTSCACVACRYRPNADCTV